VGGAAARDLVLSGRSITAAEALSIGLVQAVAPDDGVVAAAVDYARVVVETPRHLLVRTKAKIVARAAITLGPTLDL
jgi:enoyl-CoA hydratase/carnithine racemase